MTSKNYLARPEYNYADFDDMEEFSVDPFAEFGRWFDAVLASGEIEANAMSLATVDKNDQPHSRIVLMKSFSPAGIIFFTNYDSLKAHDIAENNQVALLFWWRKLARQVRITGTVKKISSTESADYFATRDRSRQLSAIISPQSKAIQSRAALEQKIAAHDTAHPAELACPDYWGGYCVTPDYFEFWQAREHRLHDRLSYLKQNNEWRKQRLAP